MLVTSGLTKLLAVLGTFGLTVTAITTAAYGLFRLFGDRWLSAKFNERLEDYKHAQQREMEALRFNIGALMDRTTKLHQHEFDALPEIWARLNDAFGEVSSLISPFQTYPDLDKMIEPHLNEFLDSS